MARTNTYAALWFDSLTTVTATTDITTLANGPKDGAGARLEGRACRSIMCGNNAAGTTIEVTRLDGTQVVVTRNAQNGVEYPVQAKKLLPACTVAELIILW